MDDGEVGAQLGELRAAHQQAAGWDLIGRGDDGVAAIQVEQDFLRRGERVGIGDQVLAELSVDVVRIAAAVDGVE